jgi:hypothetical protein
MARRTSADAAVTFLVIDTGTIPLVSPNKLMVTSSPPAPVVSLNSFNPVNENGAPPMRCWLARRSGLAEDLSAGNLRNTPALVQGACQKGGICAFCNSLVYWHPDTPDPPARLLHWQSLIFSDEKGAPAGARTPSIDGGYSVTVGIKLFLGVVIVITTLDEIAILIKFVETFKIIVLREIEAVGLVEAAIVVPGIAHVLLLYPRIADEARNVLNYGQVPGLNKQQRPEAGYPLAVHATSSAAPLSGSSCPSSS